MIMYAIITTSLVIRDWNCNCQKISHLTLSSLYLLLYFTSQCHLILVTFILYYLLVLDYLMLKLNKSHNILEKPRRPQPNFCICSGDRCKKLCGSVWIAVFTRPILGDYTVEKLGWNSHWNPNWNPWEALYHFCANTVQVSKFYFANPVWKSKFHTIHFVCLPSDF